MLPSTATGRHSMMSGLVGGCALSWATMAGQAASELVERRIRRRAGTGLAGGRRRRARSASPVRSARRRLGGRSADLGRAAGGSVAGVVVAGRRGSRRPRASRGSGVWRRRRRDGWRRRASARRAVGGVGAGAGALAGAVGGASEPRDGRRLGGEQGELELEAADRRSRPGSGRWRPGAGRRRRARAGSCRALPGR